MRQTAWWGLLSSAAAPVLLIGGWTVAAALQPGEFDSVTMTISALAGRGATDRAVMTVALAGLGACHLLTASALHPVAVPGRVLLGLGGAATVLVSVFPLPADDSPAPMHTAVATVALTALAVWPAASWRRHPPTWVLRAGVSVGATAVLLAALGWFAVELVSNGAAIGLAERVAAGSQALCPLVVVLASRRPTQPNTTNN